LTHGADAPSMRDKAFRDMTSVEAALLKTLTDPG
jgi:hypothetical protein